LKYFVGKVAKNVSGGCAVTAARNKKQIQHIGYTTLSMKPGVYSGTAQFLCV
jgi:hypothetical protein